MNPETRQCQNCKNRFVVEPEDFAFYEKIKVPPPTWCPECRLIRRLTWRNERTLYRRECDLCHSPIISMYPSATVFPVYCRSCWYSDSWDPLSYGRNYDFQKPFFEQFRELQKLVPRVATQIDKCVNCDFSNQIANCKNCYLITSGADNEDCLYTHRILYSKDVVDGYGVLRCEKCYEISECIKSSSLVFSEDCIDSTNLAFCYDAHGAQNCFLSSNIRQSSYVFLNTPFTKEEYLHKREEEDTGSYAGVQKLRRQFETLRRKSIHKFANIKNSEGVTGHAISYAKNCRSSFYVGDVENVCYSLFVNDAKDAYDINNGCCVMELAYEVSTMGVHAYNVKLSVDAWPEARDVTYVDTCRNGASNLFGCISVRRKSHCVLNKQYSKEEYQLLVAKIVDHMNRIPYKDSRGRVYTYGEFFPPQLSPFAYNESVAQVYFPLTKEEALAQGYSWRDPEERHYEITVKYSDLPDHIKDVPDSIIQEVISCSHYRGETSIVTCNEQCATAFRIIPQELEFYRKMNLPLPRLCPNCRHYQRIKQINPLKLWHRKCTCGGTNSENGVYKNQVTHFHGQDHCPNEFETSYAPEKPEIVYCEQCYQGEVV